MTTHHGPFHPDRPEADGTGPAVPVAAIPRPSLRFRGWAVVAGSFAVQAICFGAIYSFPAFAMGAASGPLADRFGARWPVAAGIAVMACGFLLAAAARSFAQVLVCYGLLVGAGAGMAYVPAIAAVQRWFVAWRGLASGLATSGVGAGTAMVPVSASLLGLWGDWRMAFLIAGCSIAVVGAIAASLLARSPEACGMGADGGAAPGRAPRPTAPVLEGAGIGEALGGALYPRLAAGSVLLSVPVALPYADVVAAARGAVSDRFGRDRTLLACCFGVAATMAWWAEARSAAGYIAFALGFGLFQGGFVALLPSVVVDLYGRRAAGGLIGVLFTGRALSVLLGVPGLAALAAAGHAASLWVACGLSLVGTGLISSALGLRRPARGARCGAGRVREAPPGRLLLNPS